MERLTRRADYVAVASGIKAPAGAFVLQARVRGDARPARFGFTVAKKVGNAPERNRIRRRLKEMVRVTAVMKARAGFDYVLVGRRAALGLTFGELVGEFESALERAHRRAARQSPAADMDRDARQGRDRDGR